MKTLALVLAHAAVCASMTSAAVMVDQANKDAQEFSGATHILSSRDWTQSFRVGKTGEMTGLDLLLMRAENVQAPLLIDVRMMDAGRPTADDEGSNVLAKAVVSPENVPSMPDVVGYDLNAAAMVHVPLPRFSVVEGQSLAIVLRSSTPSDAGFGYMWLTGNPGKYPPGQMFSRPPGAMQWVDGPADTGFRTYVDVVPEPTALTLAVTSVVLVAAVRNASGRNPSRRLRRSHG